jgi:hypothetical protein
MPVSLSVQAARKYDRIINQMNPSAYSKEGRENALI